MKLDELISAKQHVSGIMDIGYATEVLSKHGFTQIGSGSTGRVYSNPKINYVLKVFDIADKPYLQYANFAKQHSSNPHFPKFRGKVIQITSSVYATRMEMLERYDLFTYPYNDVIEWFITMLTSNFDWKIKINKPGTSKHLAGRINDYIAKWPQFANCIELISQFRQAGKDMYFDLHSGNMMMRGDCVVFTDPVST